MTSYPKDPSYQKGYPTQAHYPGQNAPPAHPSAPPAYPGMPQMPMGNPAPYHYPYGAPQQPSYYGPPPPYYPPAPAQQIPPHNPGYPVQAGFNYSLANATPMATFDSGARFDGIATHNIPPPPPGVAANAAQMAAASGAPVVATQKQSSWFSGGSGGGVSFW